jgi:hypothetical protein
MANIKAQMANINANNTYTKANLNLVKKMVKAK